MEISPNSVLVVIVTLISFPFLLYLIISFPINLLWRRNFVPQQRCGRKPSLPPGSMGWPYIGETFQLYSSNPNCFFNLKEKRYGSIFKSHILGCPCVMVSSPEAAREVLVTRAELFKPTFPGSKERILGRQAIFFHQGPYHARLRRLILRAFLPDSIRRSVARLDAIAVRLLRSWEGRTINTFHEMKTYAFNVSLLSIFGKDDKEILDLEELKSCYMALERGYNSMPINLPGTLFHTAMKARAQLAQIIAQILQCRRQRRVMSSSSSSNIKMNDDGEDATAPSPAPAAPRYLHVDLLSSLMEEEELTDAQITDNIIGVLFAARDTTASVLTWIFKYLAENPDILQAVTEEQEEIMKSKLEREGYEEEDGVCCDSNSKTNMRSLTWSDTKRMPITTRVIQETMRVASILSFTFREAVEDVELQGYLIPKGWKVLPLFRNIHHNPDNFSDPDAFDPSRFEASPKPNTYLPFGTGPHSCPGNELAKLEMLVLVHHITTKYRWSCASGSKSGIQFGPFALPLHGLPARIMSRAAWNKSK